MVRGRRKLFQRREKSATDAVLGYYVHIFSFFRAAVLRQKKGNLMELDEAGMGWHSLKRFRKTWLRGRRCLEDINNFWMAHKPKTMSELYSHLHEELEMRLAEAERVEYGFDLPKPPSGECGNKGLAVAIAPNAPRKSGVKSQTGVAA